MSKLLYMLFFSPFLMLFTYSAAHQDQGSQDPFGSAAPVASTPALPGQARPARVPASNATTLSNRFNVANGFARSTRSNHSPMAKAIQDLKNAEDDEQKQQEALDEISELLEEQYDAFLVSNEEQIEQLQDRLNQLKDQLKRRRKAKDDLVDLELTRILNETKGLVWPSNNSRNGFFETQWRNIRPSATFPNQVNGFSNRDFPKEAPEKPASPRTRIRRERNNQSR